MAQASRRYFELFNEIGIIAQLTRSIMERRLPDGLSQPHFTVLNHLVRLGDGQTPGDLARAFQVPRNSMTNTLAGLEKRGLIDVRPNRDDARSRQIYLTDAGRIFRKQAIDALASDIQLFAEKIPLQDIEAIVPALTRMRKVLDESRSG